MCPTYAPHFKALIDFPPDPRDDPGGPLPALMGLGHNGLRPLAPLIARIVADHRIGQAGRGEPNQARRHLIAALSRTIRPAIPSASCWSDMAQLGAGSP